MDNWERLNVCQYKDVNDETKLPPINIELLVCYGGIKPRREVGYFVILSKRLMFYTSAGNSRDDLPQYWANDLLKFPEEVLVYKNNKEKSDIEERIAWLNKQAEKNISIANSLKSELRQYE
jgi:hypothetical protein